MADDMAQLAELERLEEQQRSQEAKLRELATTQVQHGVKLDQHGTKLDQIITAVTRYDARPAFDLQKTTSMIRDVFVVGSALSGLAVWLILTLTAADTRLAENEQKHQAWKIDLLMQFTGLTAARSNAVAKGDLLSGTKP